MSSISEVTRKVQTAKCLDLIGGDKRFQQLALVVQRICPIEQKVAPVKNV
jgi:hypothetical protein